MNFTMMQTVITMHNAEIGSNNRTAYSSRADIKPQCQRLFTFLLGLIFLHCFTHLLPTIVIINFRKGILWMFVYLFRL